MLEVDPEREWVKDALREWEAVNVTGELRLESAREWKPMEFVERGESRVQSAGSVTALCIGGLTGYGVKPGGFLVLDRTLRWRFGPAEEDGSRPVSCVLILGNSAGPCWRMGERLGVVSWVRIESGDEVLE
jgi:hypothetical protein